MAWGVAVAMFGLCAFGWWVNWSLATRATIQPYAIVIDPGGMVLWSGPPVSYDERELWAMTAVQEWVKRVRERRQDPVHQAERRAEARQMVDGAAVEQLEAYFKAVDGDPQQAANPMRIQVGQFRWKPPAGHEYEVEWTETWTPTYGTQSFGLQVSARFTVETRQATTPFGKPQLKVGELNRNPFRMYVTYVSWMERWLDETVQTNKTALVPPGR